MAKKHVQSYFTLLLMFTSLTANSATDLPSTAANHYQNSHWQAAATAYRQLLNESPDHVQYRYRLVQSLIDSKQGQQALKVNEPLLQVTSTSAQLVWYQRAQAAAFSEHKAVVLEALSQSVQAGYSNTKELQNNHLWTAWQSTSGFQTDIKQADHNLRPCMHDERYRAFDFWIGHWALYGNPEIQGPLFGHNTISQTEQACLLMEHWQGASGTTGTSMNCYHGTVGKWVQRRLSAGGTVIDYSGGLITTDSGQQAMQLTGEIHYAQSSQQPQLRDFRGTWTSLDDGVVRQFFEESVDVGQTWYSWFDGYYFPIAPAGKDQYVKMSWVFSVWQEVYRIQGQRQITAH